MDPVVDLIDQMSIMIQRGGDEGAVGFAGEQVVQVFTQHSWDTLQRLANKLRTAATEPRLYELAVKGLLELTGGESVSSSKLRLIGSSTKQQLRKSWRRLNMKRIMMA